MYTFLVLGSTLFLTVYFFFQLRSLQRYIAEAKSTGLPYVVVPFGLFSLSWQLLQNLFLPSLSRLPKTWTERWLPYLLLARGWHAGYEPFKNVGADTYITVSPTGNILYTCDPEGTDHLLRSNAFDKPADLISILNIFGPTMTGTKNQEARTYRKITTGFFNEHTMQKVWQNATHGAESVLKVFAKKQEEAKRVEDLRPILARLSFYLLNATCFDYTEDCLPELEDQCPVPAGHKITFSKAMHTMLDRFPIVFFTPRVLLKNSFLNIHKQAYEAYTELRGYLEQLRDDKAHELQLNKGKQRNGEELNIADLIVGASDLGGTSPNSTLSPSAVLGNIFIFLFAGHEANANTLLFTILLLACHPSKQIRLQADIDRILTPATPPPNPSKHPYETHYKALSQSMIGAVIHESLRLFPILPFIPKCVPPDSPPQPLTLHPNRTHPIPPNTLILINTTAIHHHPHHWPQTHPPSKNPLLAFNPDHWLPPNQNQPLLHPKPGTFIPFSAGIRGCLGKKFALVELVALVTHIFRDYSVELAVDGQGGKESWEKARRKAERELCEGVEFGMSLRLVGHVPVVFVKRGEERFF